VERLSVHLPNENYITYHANANMSQILSQEFLRRTMLTEWFVANERHENARSLTYPDFPSEWRWDEKKILWEHRQHHGKIGRIHFVHPSIGERYYVRMLLMVVKGAQNYESLQTYDLILHSTFKEACIAHGLLEDEQEWYNAFDEAASWATSNQLRQLFVTMLLFCEVGDELSFFEKVWRLLADDIQYNTRQMLNHYWNLSLRTCRSNGKWGKRICNANTGCQSHNNFLPALWHSTVVFIGTRGTARPCQVHLDPRLPSLSLEYSHERRLQQVITTYFITDTAQPTLLTQGPDAGPCYMGRIVHGHLPALRGSRFYGLHWAFVLSRLSEGG
jgi:hypothetical protein